MQVLLKENMTSVRTFAYLVCVLTTIQFNGPDVSSLLLISPILLVFTYIARFSWLGCLIAAPLSLLLVGAEPQPSWPIFIKLFTFYILAVTGVIWFAFKNARIRLLTMYAGITTFLTYLAAGMGGGIGALFVFGPRALRRRAVSYTEFEAHFAEVGLKSPIILGALLCVTVFVFVWVFGSLHIRRVLANQT